MQIRAIWAATVLLYWQKMQAMYPKMKKEYEDIVAKLPSPGKEWDHVYSHADSTWKVCAQW
jgi:hypothetical protein